MTLQNYLQVMRPAVEADLQGFIGRSIPQYYPELHDMLTYHMGWKGEGAGPDSQGKRIRPLLVLLTAEAAGGRWQSALPASTAVELLHNFSLIHDDIQDNSPLRRNRPTVWVKWGMPQAINTGDVMFTLAFMAVQGLAASLPAHSVLEASRILQETCLLLTQGQYLDISYEDKPSLSIDDYWRMIGGKTSALLSCCTQLGALAGGASEGQVAYFKEYGYSLGLAFQVLDDWLGIWGDVALTGKSAESDLVSGKKTLPVLHGLSLGGPFARRWLQGNITAADVPALAQMLEAEGANTYTLETAGRLTDQALTALRKAVGDRPATGQADAAQALEELTSMLLRRKN